MRNPRGWKESLLAVMLREMKRMVRPSHLFCILVVPVLCLLFFTSLMDEGLPHNLPVAVVDEDGSAQSRAIVRMLDAMDQVEVKQVFSSYAEARQAVQRGEIYAFLAIPPRFAHDVNRSARPTLTLYISQGYLVPGSLTYKALRQAAELASGAVGRTQLYARGVSERAAMAQLQPIVVDSHAVNNPALNYSIYLCNTLVPGCMMLIISVLTVLTMGIEIKEGTMRQWLNVGNHSITLSLLGKLLPYTAAFMAVGALVDWYLYGVLAFPNQGGWPMTLLLTLAMVVASQALGIMFFALVPTLRMGMSLCSLWGVISFSICGFSYPTMAMWEPLQALANLFPLRHYFLIYASQTLDGNPLSYHLWHYAALAAFVVAAGCLASRLKDQIIYSYYIK